MNSKEFRRWLRQNATFSEMRLWSGIRKRQIMNKKFRRQHSINNYIVDFYCAELKLILEVDGNHHNDIIVSENDFLRDQELEKLSYHVLRIDAIELKDNYDQVIHEIELKIVELENEAI